jgi:hypothetical protein
LRNKIRFYSPSDVSVAKISFATTARVITIVTYDRCFGCADYYCEYLPVHYYELNEPKHTIDRHLLQDLSLFKVLKLEIHKYFLQCSSA